MKLARKFFLLVLISVLSVAYGLPPSECPAGVPVDISGYASGGELFGFRNIGCSPGRHSFFGDAVIAKRIIFTVTCTGGGSDCLVLSADINSYFSTPKDPSEVQEFFGNLAVRSADYMPVTARLSVTGTYEGAIEQGVTTIRMLTDRYDLTLVEDPPPVLTDRTTLAVKKVDGLVDNAILVDGKRIFFEVVITDTGTVTFLATEVIDDVRITQKCSFSHGADTENCLSSFDQLVKRITANTKNSDAQDFLRNTRMKIPSNEVEASNIPTSVRLSLTLVSGLESGPGENGLNLRTDTELARVTDTNTLDYALIFAIPGIPPRLEDPTTEQVIFRTGKRVFSSIRVVNGGDRTTAADISIEQECGQEQTDCVRMEPLPGSFNGTVAEVEDFLRGIAVAPANDDVLSATLTVKVSVAPADDESSTPSSSLKYSLTFKSGTPVLSDISTDSTGNVTGTTPFGSIKVIPRQADTVRSVVIEFECLGRTTCVNANGVSGTGGAEVVQLQSTALKVGWGIGGTEEQAQSSLRALVMEWGSDYSEPREATVRVFLRTSVRNIFGEVISRSTTPLEYRLSFTVPGNPRLSDVEPLVRIGAATGFLPLSSIALETSDSETVVDIAATLECVNGATTCASFVGDKPSDFSGTTLDQAENFLKALSVRSRFASYQAELTVSVMTLLRGLERQSNELTYTLTFPTLGSAVRDRLVAPAFAEDLGIDNPNLDAITPENLDLVKMAVAKYCEGDGSSSSDYFADSDGDGVPNNVEAQLGTDCRDPNPDNVAGEDQRQGRPVVTLSGELVLDQLPFSGNLEDLGIQFECKAGSEAEPETCVEVLLLEKQSGCTSANSNSDSVFGNGDISFPGVNESVCYFAGRFSSSPTGSEGSASLYGTLFPMPSWSELYVLGVDKFGNWSVSGGDLGTQAVYTPPVLSLGTDVYSDTNMANIGVELRGRQTPLSPSLSVPPDTLEFTLNNDGGSFGNVVQRADMTVPVDLSGTRVVMLLTSDAGVAIGRSALTVNDGSSPPFISIGLKKGESPASVISLDGADYSLDVNVPPDSQSSFRMTILDEVFTSDDLDGLLGRVADTGLPGGLATLKVQVSNSGNTREAEFPVFSSTQTVAAANAAAWTEGVVSRDIVVAGCLTDLCDPGRSDNPFAYASVNVVPGSYLSRVVASSLTDFAVSFDKVRETLNKYVSEELNLDSGQVLTDFISYSVAVSNASADRASFVLDLRHKPFTENGRLAKRIRIDGGYEWRGAHSIAQYGSVWYTTRLDSTCPSPDDDAAWTGTDNGVIPASADDPVRCVRLDIVDGGLYANGSNGYYSGSIVGVSSDASIPLAPHAGGGDGGNSDWLIILAALATWLYAGSAGVWTLFALALLLVFTELLRRRRKRATGEV